MKILKIRLDELILCVVLGAVFFVTIGNLWGQETAESPEKIPLSLAMESSLVDLAKFDRALAPEVRAWILVHTMTTADDYIREYNRLNKLAWDNANKTDVRAFMSNEH